MAFDTPATVAVIGAGPIGIEAALYARFLGYDVVVFDKGGVCDHVLQWGHVTLFTPFSMNCTSLGLAAIAAQDETYQPPEPAALLTGSEWVDRYLRPLANTDLINGSLREKCEVQSVSRREFLKGDAVGDDVRGDDEFRILYHDPNGEETEEFFDIVIDASGVFSQPNWLGSGGGPAVGERSLGNRIIRQLPDVLGRDRSRFAGRTTLVVGSGYSAATTVNALCKLRERQEDAPRNIYWITRREANEPLARIDEDRLPCRDAVAVAANAAAHSEDVIWLPQTQIVSLRETDDGSESAEKPLLVKLSNEKVIEVDQVVSHVGFHVDAQLYRELQVHQCYATEGPMKLAAALLSASNDTHDCLQQTAHGADSLTCPEPNFYILGAKSYGRNSQFLMQVGYQQIKELFAMIGDREALDLYANAPQTN